MKPLYRKIAIMIVIAELAGIVGSVFTAPAIGEWYSTLEKPMWTPPGWVFAPVWLSLYALMGIAAGIIWNSKSKIRKNALSIYGIQLVLNILWSIIFFGIRSPGYAFAEIVLLWLAIWATMSFFTRISKKAGWMLMPYILWVTIAAALNYSIWMMN